MLAPTRMAYPSRFKYPYRSHVDSSYLPKFGNDLEKKKRLYQCIMFFWLLVLWLRKQFLGDLVCFHFHSWFVKPSLTSSSPPAHQASFQAFRNLSYSPGLALHGSFLQLFLSSFARWHLTADGPLSMVLYLAGDSSVRCDLSLYVSELNHFCKDKNCILLCFLYHSEVLYFPS